MHCPISDSAVAATSSVSPPVGAWFILQLHDELIYEVHASHVRAVASMVQEQMENCMKLSTIMPVKVKVGDSWGNLKEFDV